jgi:DNA-binding PadR family transcriptional regulator
MAPQQERGVTDLEAAALGAIAKNEPITGYRLKETFGRSLSRFWSGSAGAIYPLLTRLEARGLIAAKQARRGKMNVRTYSITRAGREALTAWIFDMDLAVDPGFDPVRTRLLFVETLDEPARVRFRDELLLRLSAYADLSLGQSGMTTAEARLYHLTIVARLQACKAFFEEMERDD